MVHLQNLAHKRNSAGFRSGSYFGRTDRLRALGVVSHNSPGQNLHQLHGENSLPVASSKADLEPGHVQANHYANHVKIEFDGTSRASSMLQTLLQDYDLECDFYVKATSNGTITDKIFEVGNKLNSEIYSGTVFVGENVTGCTRDITGNIITKLYVFGPNGETMASANGGKTYIVDDAANRQYNPNWRTTYLEGAYTSNSTTDPQGLKAIAKTILADTNHPQYAYTVTVPHTMHPRLGSVVRTVNVDFTPEMATKERVMATTESYADPSQNTIQFGEFQTVTRITPAWLSNFTSQIASAVQKAMQDSSSIDPVVLTPDGVDFGEANSTKRVIIQAYEGGTTYQPFWTATASSSANFQNPASTEQKHGATCKM